MVSILDPFGPFWDWGWCFLSIDVLLKKCFEGRASKNPNPTNLSSLPNLFPVTTAQTGLEFAASLLPQLPEC